MRPLGWRKSIPFVVEMPGLLAAGEEELSAAVDELNAGMRLAVDRCNALIQPAHAEMEAVVAAAEVAVAIIEEPALADLQAERVAAGEVLALAQAAFDARMKEADRVYEAATSMALIHREKATRAVARFTEIQKAARLDLQQEKAARIKAYRVLEHQVKARLKRAGIEMDRRSYAEGLKTA